MAGALSLVRRRHFELGGTARTQGYENPYVDTGASDMPVPTPPPQGALSSGVPEVPQTPQQQIALSQQALANLGGQQAQAIMRGRYTDPSLMEGSTNLPLLAAAGAMLKPTHSGGFSEALGNAFSAAVPVAEQERKRQTDAQLRDQLYGINQQRANTYEKRADIYGDRVAVQNAVAVRTAELKALGMDDLAADRQANRDLQQGRLDAYIARTASQETQRDRRLDQGDRRLDQGDRRGDQTDQRIAQAADKMRDSQEWHSASARLAAQKMDSVRMDNILSRAAYLKANSPGYNGQGGFDKAVNEVLQADQKQLGRGTPQSGGQPPARQSAPSGAADWRSAPDGTPITQNGVTYIKRGNDPSKWLTQ